MADVFLVSRIVVRRLANPKLIFYTTYLPCSVFFKYSISVSKFGEKAVIIAVLEIINLYIRWMSCLIFQMIVLK